MMTFLASKRCVVSIHETRSTLASDQALLLPRRKRIGVLDGASIFLDEIHNIVTRREGIRIGRLMGEAGKPHIDKSVPESRAEFLFSLLHRSAMRRRSRMTCSRPRWPRNSHSLRLVSPSARRSQFQLFRRHEERTAEVAR